MTVTQLLEEHAAHQGGKTFLFFKDEEITYQQLTDRMRALACGLVRMGVKKANNVALLIPNRPEFMYSFFGVMRAGGVAVTINTLLKGEEITYIVNNCEAEAIIVTDDHLDLFRSIKNDCPRVKHVISTTDDDDVVSFETLLNTPIDESLLPSIAESDHASIIYTSGTTGRPKGVILTHGNYISDTKMMNEAVKMTAEDRLLCILPLFHVNAQVVTTLAPLYAGASMVLMEAFSPKKFLAALERYRATAFSGVPTVYAILNNQPDAEQYDLSKLRFCVCGGAPMTVGVFEEFEKKYKAFILEGYGLSEGTCASSANPLGGKRKVGSIGLPYKGQPMKIFDDNDNEAPTGTVGEIVVRGPNVMKGYYNNPEATADTLRNGWLHTGDLGYVDEDGYFFIVGRKKEMIIRGGENIYPKEIEEVVYRHPAIREATIVGLPDEVWGEEVAAFVVLRDQSSLTEEDLINYCKEHLADYKCPRKVFFVQDLPKTATGKIQKNKVVEKFLAERGGGG
jgi:long-chain acyl-CoA synthetase